MFKIDPLFFFTPNRLDLVIKLIYGESILRKSNAKYPRTIYKKHLFSITGGNGKFKEWGNIPPKVGFNAFVEVFRSLIGGTAENFPPVRVNNQFRLNNGAHRIVAAFLQKKPISVLMEFESREANADYTFFRKGNRFRYRFSQNDLDYVLLKLFEVNPTLGVLVVFPTMRNKKVIESLKSHEKYFLERSFRLNWRAKNKILHFLYPESQNFINLNSLNTHRAFNDRFNLPGKLRLFFFCDTDTNNLAELKHFLRGHFNLPNGSIHSQDNSDEIRDLLEVLLLKNSRKHLHKFNLAFGKSMRTTIDTLSYSVSEMGVVGSSPLALIGIRNSRDIDIISRSHCQTTKNDKFDIDNSRWIEKGFNLDELLDNPKNYVSIYGVKYVAVRNIIKFKLLRRKRKDFIDIFKYVWFEISDCYTFVLTLVQFIKGHIKLLRNLYRKCIKALFRTKPKA